MEWVKTLRLHWVWKATNKFWEILFCQILLPLLHLFEKKRSRPWWALELLSRTPSETCQALSKLPCKHARHIARYDPLALKCTESSSSPGEKMRSDVRQAQLRDCQHSIAEIKFKKKTSTTTNKNPNVTWTSSPSEGTEGKLKEGTEELSRQQRERLVSVKSGM